MKKTKGPSVVPGVTDLSSCTCANLRQAARVVTQAYDSALKPAGIKATQFTILATLSEVGDQPLTKLAEALVMDRTTLTRNLKPLTAKGWVFTAQEDDQRVRQVGLTDKGRGVYKTALPLWRKAQRKVTGVLGLSVWNSVIQGLKVTVDAVQAR